MSHTPPVFVAHNEQLGLGKVPYYSEHTSQTSQELARQPAEVRVQWLYIWDIECRDFLVAPVDMTYERFSFLTTSVW